MSEQIHEVNLVHEGINTPINIPDCYTRIAELAFYKAEIRSFEPGHEFDVCVEAEREFKEMIVNNIPH